ncbi:MAG TPA: hypothetical protein VFJ97_13760 [Dermatophilaceae bacterium]|nr:hypothetical protein [Dermatophilaceae bacterium]
MRLIDSRAVQLAKYLETGTARRLAEWDAQSAFANLCEIEVYCLLGWRDITRALTAAKLIESEMRRGARAVLDAYGPPNDRGSLPSSPEPFLRHLAKFPMPQHTNVSTLEIIEIAGPPLALRLGPTNDAQAALAHAAASTVGYTLAGFGREFAIEWITGRNLRAGDRELAAITGFTASGEPGFNVTSRDGIRAVDLENTYFQPVSSPFVREFGFEVHVVVQRISGDHVQLVHAWK